MYSTHKEGKSVTAERFIKTLKAKIYKEVTANDSKSFKSIIIINKNHHYINKKPINADYSASTEKIETNPKAPKSKINDRVRITKYKNFQ